MFIFCDFSSARVEFKVKMLVVFYKKSCFQHFEGSKYFKNMKLGLSNFVFTGMKYNIYLRNDLGLVYESCERFDEAVDCFTTSLELEQTAPIVSYTSLPRLFKAYDNSWIIQVFELTLVTPGCLTYAVNVCKQVWLRKVPSKFGQMSMIGWICQE